MNIFQAIQPSLLLSSYIKQYWYLELRDIERISQRIVPTGNCGIYFLLRGKEMYSPTDRGLLPASYVYGQSSVPADIVFSGTVRLVAVIFQSIGAMAFFRMPMDELKEQKIMIDSLDDPDMIELEKRLMDCSEAMDCVSLIETFLINRLYRFDAFNYKRLNTAMQLIDSGQYDVEALAESTCLGYKQFKRIFTACVGTNPKDFLRVTRFQKASQMMQTLSGVTLTQLADKSGYYDKSHLIKDFKLFSGFSPNAYLSACDPYSEYHSFFRSTFMDIKLPKAL